MGRPSITLSKELPVRDFIRDYTDFPMCEKACSECPRFGLTWACPPYDFDREELWQKYSSVMLYGKKVFVPGSLRASPLSAQELSAAWKRLLEPEKARLMAELYAMEQSTPGSLALSSGGCSLCESCTRPRGLPCRDQKRMRHSVESLGGNVEKCVRELLGVPLLWAEDGFLPEYFVLMGALLIP